MTLEYTISPLGSLTRKAKVKNFIVELAEEIIRLDIILNYYNGENILPKFTREISLRAGNTTYIDSTTLQGVEITYDENGDPIIPQGVSAEFDFWINYLQTQTFDMTTVFGALIAVRDAEGKFE